MYMFLVEETFQEKSLSSDREDHTMFIIQAKEDSMSSSEPK